MKTSNCSGLVVQPNLFSALRNNFVFAGHRKNPFPAFGNPSHHSGHKSAPILAIGSLDPYYGHRNVLFPALERSITPAIGVPSLKYVKCQTRYSRTIGVFDNKSTEREKTLKLKDRKNWIKWKELDREK